jgi:hypothetical protein
MSRGALGGVLVFAIALAVPACGGKGGGKSGGSGGGGGSTGAGGQAATGIDGSAGNDGSVGTDADHTVTTWPDFPPGKCAPMKPAVLDSPGVVDPETLCERSIAYPIVIAPGEWGYGSIANIDTSTEDTSWPDTDIFSLQPAPTEGQVVRITIETVVGTDFQPHGSFYPNGGSGVAFGPLPNEPGKARREVLTFYSPIECQLMIADKRAVAKGDAFGAGSVYRVRVDFIEKTPVDPGPLPVLTTRDFTSEGLVGVYAFTVPPQRGRLLVNVVAAMRLTGLPASPVFTSVMIFDPATKKAVRRELHDTTQDTIVGYEANSSSSPSTTLLAGKYWLMVDSRSAVAELARSDYDVGIEFRGPPANDTCATAIDATPTGTATRTTTGDTTYGANDSTLSNGFVSSACYQATLSFPSLGGRDVFYSVVVPPRKRLTATVTPMGSWHAGLWLSTTCTAGEISCLAASASAGNTNPQTVAWTNVATTDRTVYLTVDSPSDQGAFSLATSFTDGPAAPANDTCGGAIALNLSSGGTTVSGTTDGAGDDEHPGVQTVSAACRDTAAYYNGADVVYTAVVPAGRRLSVTAFPSGSFNPALWISETCANPEPTCLAARDGDGTRENVVWTNAGTTDKPVVIHVDAQDPVGGMFTLSATLGAPKACPTTTRDPTVAYVSRTNNTGNDFIFTAANVSAACAAAVTSPLIGDDDITAFDVPAGTTLSISIRSTITVNGAPVDKWVGLLTTACGTVAESGAACVAAGTLLSWRNTGSATQRVYLFMDLASRSPAQADYNVLPSLQ